MSKIYRVIGNDRVNFVEAYDHMYSLSKS
ncbi:hypothetical protein TELCIR_13407 [Teladorsagia circumcincta]|uniref:Uncharacterized protein n=1 Tax=Teladorsagia circumcincta TaxID=45464 RepID=A0A2G9U472_TELCI|nr:hypothetical protein TELCIR_13407 [Teladorsagia circumcincta]